MKKGIMIFMAMWGGILFPASVFGAKKVTVGEIKAQCCYQEQVEVVGTITHFEATATESTYFYYLQDDYGTSIKVVAGGKPDVKPGQRLKVIGTVSQSPTEAFYLTEQTHAVEAFLGGAVSGPLFYLIIISAVVLAVLIGVIIYFLIAQSQRQEEATARQDAEKAAQAREVEKLKARLEDQIKQDKEARARAAAAQIKQRTELKESPAPQIIPRYQRAFFKIIQGPEAEATLPLKAPVTTIGRDPGNDIVLKDDRVSANHARVEEEGGTYYLVDAGSTNGTYLNGNRITTRTPLLHGHRVRMGRVEMAFIAEV